MSIATSSIDADAGPHFTGVRQSAAAPPYDPDAKDFSRLIYRAGWLIGRFIWLCTMKVEVIRPAAMNRRGPYLLASNHLSHLEPFVLSIVYRRTIDWVTRIEFFRRKWVAWLIRRVGGFPIHRQGVPVSAMRTAIARVGRGHVVGICPEGGVTIRKESVCRGGRIKQGVCLISLRSGVPVVPCIMLGTHTLTRVGPWLPFRRGRLWIAFGEAVTPPENAVTRKAGRQLMAVEIERQFALLYNELLQTYGIEDGAIP